MAPDDKGISHATIWELPIAPSSLGHLQLLAALRAFRKGDFSARLPIGSTEIDADIAEAFNDIVSLGERITGEFVQLAQTVGKSGKTRHRADVPNATGAWAVSIDAVNGLVGDLLPPTAEMVRVIEAVAKGDLSQRMTIGGDGRDLRGEFLHIGEIVNTMVDSSARSLPR
jgi:methyl-accepting chemotaxis protein